MSSFSERISTLLFEFLPLGVGGYAVYKTFFGNRFYVEHGARERLVIKNKVTGELEILGQGAHYKPIWFESDTRVDLNKEPIESEDHKAKSSDGIDIVVKVRYNILTGRDFDKVNGQLKKDKENDSSGAEEHIDPINDDNVKLAVTATDFRNRRSYVRGIVSSVIDAVIREFPAEELLVVLEADEFQVKVPKHWGDKHAKYNLPERTAKNGHQLFDFLSRYMQREINYRLRDVGFNVDELAIEDLRPTNSELQESFDNVQELRNKMRSVHQLDGDPNASKLSERERFALNTPHQGQVTLAEAIRYAAEQFQKALESFKKS